jgi:hypothetical protein
MKRTLKACRRFPRSILCPPRSQRAQTTPKARLHAPEPSPSQPRAVPTIADTGERWTFEAMDGAGHQQPQAGDDDGDSMAFVSDRASLVPLCFLCYLLFKNPRPSAFIRGSSGSPCLATSVHTCPFQTRSNQQLTSTSSVPTWPAARNCALTAKPRPAIRKTTSLTHESSTANLSRIVPQSRPDRRGTGLQPVFDRAR